MNKQVSRLTGFLIIAVVLSTFALPGTAAAQEQGGIICYGWYSLNSNNDRVVTGTISNNDPAHEWTFEGEAGTFATIVMEVTDGTLDPFLYVTDTTTGQRLASASANDIGGQRVVTIKNLPLNSDGNYVITATRLGEATGTSAGSYRLSLEPGLGNAISSDDDYAAMWNILHEARIYDGEVLRSRIPNISSLDIWYFEGQRGQLITIVMRGIEGTEVVHNRHYISLWKYSNNEWMGEDYYTYDTGGVNDQSIRITNHTLSATGTFAVAVSTQGAELENYEITLAGAGGTRPELPECGGPAPECPATSPLGAAAALLTADVPVDGGITGASPIVPYQFVALEGDVVTVNMQRTGGDLDTFLGLADGRGNVLARDSGFDPAASAINQFVIPADGCYFVYASREDVSDGTTEGTFMVTVTGIAGSGGAAPQPPAGVTFGGDIGAGESVVGSIGTGDWQVAYRLKGDGSTYTATATRDTGDLKPAIALLDVNFNQLDYVTANFAGNASNPLTIQTEPGAYYFVVIQREDGEAGTTAGDFTFQLSAAVRGDILEPPSERADQGSEGAAFGPPQVFPTQTSAQTQFAIVHPYGEVLNVRSDPTGSSSEGNVVERLHRGEQVEILDGPRDIDDFRWWKVRTPRGNEGWCAEVVQGYQTLALLIETPADFPTVDACSGAPLARMKVGYQGQTEPYDHTPTVIRSAPGGERVDAIGPGVRFDVLGGPECATVRGVNYTWWYIREHNRNIDGWVAEGTTDRYWIEPVNQPNRQ
jgi:hypothetical protein